MTNRDRKVDPEKLTVEQAELLSVQIGDKIRELQDKTINEVNKMLNIYGMEAKMSIVIGKIGEFDIKKEKKTRKKKDANL